PNGDGRSDTTTVTVHTRQALRLGAEIRDVSGTQQLGIVAQPTTMPAGDHAFTWNGRDGTGTVLHDDKYRLVVTATDACGRSISLPAVVEVDNTPPATVITRPGNGDAVGVAVDVRGIAGDKHFVSFALTYGVGPAPDTWLPVVSGAYEVGTGPSGPGFF